MHSVRCMSLSLWAIDFRPYRLLYLTRIHKIASDCTEKWHVFFGQDYQDFGPFKVGNHPWRARSCCIYALLLEQIHPTRLQSSMVLLRFETCCSRKPIHFAPAVGIRRISRRRECPNRCQLLYSQTNSHWGKCALRLQFFNANQVRVKCRYLQQKVKHKLQHAENKVPPTKITRQIKPSKALNICCVLRCQGQLSVWSSPWRPAHPQHGAAHALRSAGLRLGSRR